MTHTIFTPNPTTKSTRTAIYVHGLASGAAGSTCQALATALPDYRWITTDFGENLEKNVVLLNELIAEHNAELVVGSSMGGLAVIFADAPKSIKVVHNPALSLADCVRNTIGYGRHNYFCQRMDGATEFELLEAHCALYEQYIASHTITAGRESYAIFAAHDELLGDSASIAAQKIVKEHGFTITVDPRGQHRLAPSTIEIICALIAKNERVPKIRTL